MLAGERFDGWLVPPEDPVALAQSLLLLLENPTQRSEMGTAAQRKVALQFTLDRMVRETLSFYQHLL